MEAQKAFPASQWRVIDIKTATKGSAGLDLELEKDLLLNEA